MQREYKTIMTENVDIAKKCLELTNIVRDVDIDFQINKCKFSNHNINEIIRVFESYELRNSLNNLRSIINFDDNLSDNKSILNNYEAIPEENLILVNDQNSFEKMFNDLINSDHFSFDTETTGLNTIDDEIIGISFSNSENLAWYLVIKHDNENVFFDKNIYEKIKELF